MATQKNSNKINLYNLALLSLQGYELENVETMTVGNEKNVLAFMRKERVAGNIKKNNLFVLNLSAKAGSLSASKLSKSVSEELEEYMAFGKNGIKPSTFKVLRTFVKAQNSNSVENNIENGSFQFNVEKMFADLMEATAYSDVNLMFNLRNLSDNLDKAILGESSNIVDELSKEEVIDFKEDLKHLNNVVTGKEPSNTSKVEQSRVR